MRFELAFLLLVAVAVSAQSPASSKADKNDAKFLTSLSFTTFTIAKSTTTTTSTFTSIVTCTTSTGTLSTCTAGRRRRGLFYSEGENRNRRGLFYNDEEEKLEVFSNIQKRSNNPVDEVKPVKKTSDEVVVPLEIQSGFSLPKDVPANRFLVAFGTSTVTTFTVTTSTTSLTAICSSTTGFPTCSSGK